MEILIIILIIAIALLVLDRLIPKKSKSNKSWNYNAYKLKGSILTRVELFFYKVLTQEIPKEYIVCPKVGLKDFIDVTTKNNYLGHFGRIAQKHIDFLVCEKETLKPVIGIEIDDGSHQRKDRIERDKNVNKLYESLGFKILRIPTKTKIDEMKTILQNEFHPEVTTEKI